MNQKINYALWMLRSSAQSSAIQWAIALLMMAGGWGCAIQSSFGAHKPQEKLPWAVAGLILAFPSIFVLRHAQERGSWAEDGRSVLRWSRAQWQEQLMLPPPQSELSAININAPQLPAELPTLSFQQMLNFPAVLIYGAQGSGKTTLARAIGQARAASGHQVKVLDPHGDPEEWKPWQLVGAGMEYQSIQNELVNFQSAIERDYKSFASGKRNFTKQTLIADEFTNWSGRLDSETAIAFLKTCLTDIRKVGKHAIFVSHANTLEAGLAGAGGLAKLRDAGMVQLELFSEPGADGKAHPTGTGLLKIPGKPAEMMKMPDISTPLLSTQAPIALPPKLSDELLDQIASEVLEPDPRNDLEKLLNLDADSKAIDPSEMSEEELNQLIEEKRSNSKNNLSKPAQIILEKYQQLEMFGTWIDARWVQKKVRAKVVQQLNADQIRSLFQELSRSGAGQADDEDNPQMWYFDPPTGQGRDNRTNG